MAGFLWAIAAWAAPTSEQTLADAASTAHPQNEPPAFVLPSDTSPSAIVGGILEQGYPSAVGLGVDAGNLSFTVCTGSLITPRMILTAAHCGADLPIELVVQFGSAFFGPDVSDPDQVLGFTNAVIHPDYQPLTGTFLGENDVSVLVLADEAPVAPVWFRTETLKPKQTEGETVISVGWGLDENGGSSVKRSAPLVVSYVDPVFLISYSRDNDNSANICSGDSGGPQYHVEEDGTLVQWAVHSWGDLDCVYESGSTRTDKVADWILEQVEIVHGTTDRCAIFGQYGDGVCHEDCAEIDEDCIEPDPDALAEGEPKGCGCETGQTEGMFVLPAVWLLWSRRRATRTL